MGSRDNTFSYLPKLCSIAIVTPAHAFCKTDGKTMSSEEPLQFGGFQSNCEAKINPSSTCKRAIKVKLSQQAPAGIEMISKKQQFNFEIWLNIKKAHCSNIS